MAEEKRFENKIKNFIEEKNGWFIKYWAGAKYTKEGIPDILACVDGKFIAIEVKGSHGKPTVLQLVTLRNIRSAGGIGVLLYPNDFNMFIALLNGSELGIHWYRENKQLQKQWFDKLNGAS